MRYFCIILLFIFISFSGYSQNTQKITFKVDDVEIAETPLPEVKFLNALEQRISGVAEAYNTKKSDLTIISTDNNSFLTAVHYSYAQHRPLVISPDMIWLLISQGFAFHVSENSKKLRGDFVDFQEKKPVISVNLNFEKGNYTNLWTNEMDNLSEEMKKYLGKDLYETLIPKFSTTTTDETAAFTVTMMDAFEEYFEYVVMTLCGIPTITLEGSTDDWKKLKDNTLKLKKYDLEWWIPKLEPILNEFINTSKGDINVEFWKNIYKVKTEYNIGKINGWICTFFPYLNNTQKLIKNPWLTGKSKYMSSAVIPQGISLAPFKWIHIPDKKVYEMEFYAGFMGINQNKETMELKPEISWAVRDKNNTKKIKVINSETIGLDLLSYLERDEDNIIIEEKRDPETFIYVYVKQMPEFPGGKIALREYIRDKTGNNEFNNDKTVFIRFEVKRDGTIGKIEIQKGVSNELDKEAVKIVKNLPKFKPGYQSGIPVNVWYSIPIIF